MFVFPYQVCDEEVRLIRETARSVKIRRRRVENTLSFYDNNEDAEDEIIESKWTIVRQRLPEILAMSENYKPKSIRAQLVFLIALMNRKANEAEEALQFRNSISGSIAGLVSSNGILPKVKRNGNFRLKRIPSKQMIYVDFEGLSFSIPTRQFFLGAMSDDDNKSLVQLCPQPMGEMLVNLSKTKIIDDSKQFERARFKMRLTKFLFFLLYSVLIGMVFLLAISLSNTIFRFERDSKIIFQ